MLQKIRSLECDRCAQDHNPDQPPICTQEDRGSGTWKCKRCFERHLSSCEWMQSKSTSIRPPNLLTWDTECEAYGLGTRPSVQRANPLAASWREHNTSISTVNSSSSIVSAPPAPSSRPQTRASTRSFASYDDDADQVVHSVMPTPSHIVDRFFVAMFDSLNKNCEKELKAVSRQYPFEPLKVVIHISHLYIFINYLSNFKKCFSLLVFASDCSICQICSS